VVSVFYWVGVACGTSVALRWGWKSVLGPMLLHPHKWHIVYFGDPLPLTLDRSPSLSFHKIDTSYISFSLCLSLLWLS
jgi:hypothetical protein